MSEQQLVAAALQRVLSAERREVTCETQPFRYVCLPWLPAFNIQT